VRREKEFDSEFKIAPLASTVFQMAPVTGLLTTDNGPLTTNNGPLTTDTRLTRFA